jgi:hypothetical protein
MYAEAVSYSGQARGFRPYAWLGVGALGMGVWASLAGAGVAAADNQSSRASGAAVSATPTASATASKSTDRTTRSAKARAAARGLIDQGATSLMDTGRLDAPASYTLSGGWPSRTSLGQGEDFFKYHVGQH